MTTATADKTLSLPASDLVLGDTVRFFEGPYGWGTVVQIADGTVHIFRVFVHTSDFSYTGGVGHYIGTELVKVCLVSDRLHVVDSVTHDYVTGKGRIK